MREPKNLTIGGKWFVDLDQHIDVERINTMHAELAEGIARAIQYVEPVVIGSRDAQFDTTIPEVEIALKDHADDPRLQALIAEGASRELLYNYVKFAHPSVQLGKKLLLRTYKNYHSGFGTKHIARMNEDTAAYQFFPGLRSFIVDSNVFSEVGRIIIFLTERDAKSEVHCDYADGKSRKDQFIWLNPQRTKNFFVYDSDFKKQYLTGVANTFDNSSWHGGDPAPIATFSIRVDGKFNKCFLRKSGMESHFDT